MIANNPARGHGYPECLCSLYSQHLLSAEYGSTGYGCQSCSWSAEQHDFFFVPCPRSRLGNGLARQVRLPRSASARLFSTLRLNQVLNHGIPPDFRDLCMYTCSKSMGQPGKVANPARGQLNRENEYFPVRVSAGEFGLARRVRQSCPASACSS